MGKSKLHKRITQQSKQQTISNTAQINTEIENFDRTMNVVEQEEIDEDSERAELLLFQMLTSINFVIILTIVAVTFIGLSMVITMYVLGVNDNMKRKHVFGFAN